MPYFSKRSQEKLDSCDSHLQVLFNEVIRRRDCTILEGRRGRVRQNKLFEEGKISNWESYYLRKDKRVVPVEINIAYLYNEEGDIIGSVGIIRDITERKEMERNLRETKEFLEKVIGNTADGIIICDLKGNIIDANIAMEKMTGLKKEELIKIIKDGPYGKFI